MSTTVESFRPSAQQQAIFDAVSAGGTHVAVRAVAGAGKTTTAVGAAQSASGKVGFLAFNKHIADELRNQLNGAAKACTLHALGFAACRRQGGSQVDENKPKALLERIRPKWTYKGPRGGLRVHEEGQAALALARLCKLTLTPEEDSAALRELAEHYDVDIPNREDEVYEAVAEVIEETLKDTRNIDYDDMVWLPVRQGWPVERFDSLLVDEVQDLNRTQQALARQAIGDQGLLVLVGDPRQSIMGFTGADPEAFPRLIGELEGTASRCATLPLTQTRRCPHSHVALAQRLVPEIEAIPEAIDGHVEQIEPGAVRSQVSPGDMVISRRTAPLITLAFDLLAANVPVMVRGRDIGASIIDLVDQLKTSDSLVDLLMELETWRFRQVERLERKNAPESQLQSVEDRASCVKELASGAHSVRQLQETVRSLFADTTPEGKVVLSTIHRAKGLQADRVVVIDTESLPLIRRCKDCHGTGHRSAGRCETCNGRGTRTKPWQFQQELNLLYVAVTRSKRDLLFAGKMPGPLGGMF